MCALISTPHDEAEVLTPPLEDAPDPGARATDVSEDDWLRDLKEGGAGYEVAIRRLHATVERAARYQVGRTPGLRSDLGQVRSEEIVASAADLAVVQVLAGLDHFEGRSKFSTWVYKFGVHHAQAEAMRALWRHRPVRLYEQTDLPSQEAITPESYAEARDLAAATAIAMRTALTSRQRQVAVALVVEEVPIDVLAERLDTTRNSLYKMLHDARANLRAELFRHGYLRSSEMAS